MSVMTDSIEFAARVLRDTDRSDDEKGIVIRFAAAQALLDEAEKEVAAYFMPRLKTLLEAKDFEAAMRLVQRAPDCVTRVFMLDQYQHAKKGGSR